MQDVGIIEFCSMDKLSKDFLDFFDENERDLLFNFYGIFDCVVHHSQVYRNAVMMLHDAIMDVLNGG